MMTNTLQNNVLTYEINNAVDAMKIRLNQHNPINSLNDSSYYCHSKPNGQIYTRLNQYDKTSSKENNSNYNYNLVSEKLSLPRSDKKYFPAGNNNNNDNQLPFRKKPFIDRSYENDNEMLGLKNKMSYSAKVNKAIEDITTNFHPQRDLGFIDSNGKQYYYNSNHNFTQEDDSNSQFNNLTLDQQVIVLLNENKILKDKVEQYKKAFKELSIANNATKGLNDSNKEFKNFLIRENEDLLNSNKNYEEIIELFIHFINQLKIISEGKSLSNSFRNENETHLLSLEEIKTNPLLVKSFLHNLNLNNHRNEKAKERKQSKSKNKRNNSLNRSVDSYDYIRPERIANCLPCSLGYNNSSKGYSPLLCSPNRILYIKRSQTPV